MMGQELTFLRSVPLSRFSGSVYTARGGEAVRMRASPMHVVFAIILVGSLVAKDRTTDVLIESSNLEPAVMRAARSHGWALRDYTTIADTDVPALVFHAAGCAQP